MRALALVGLIAITFGVGSWYATRDAQPDPTWFQWANVGFGVAALAVAGIASLRKLRRLAAPGVRGRLARGLAFVFAALALAVGLERLADWSGARFDWTVDQRFALSEAMLRALEAEGEPLRFVLYYDDEDPRVRATRLLLDSIARVSAAEVRERRLEDHPLDADRFAVGSSNSVVVLRGDRFDTVGRPTEGTLYEALYRLRSLEAARLWIARGSGEGDIESTGPGGYSGFAEALVTEGYRLRLVVAAQGVEIPPEADALIFLSPRRRLPPPALAAVERYLEAGGRLVALLEPSVESGLEGLLAEWGLRSPDALVVDPASARGRMGVAEGTDLLAYHYTRHPIARGLDASRMTFFPGTRSFSLLKPHIDDELSDVVLASPRSWLAEDPAPLAGAPLARPANAATDYHPVVVAGRYPGEGRDTRIVAFGDAEFASNQHLRTLYNLDLAMNAVHWAVERESEIKLLPKANVAGNLQFALPIQNTLLRFYGVGLLIPELLLATAAIMWLRTRSA